MKDLFAEWYAPDDNELEVLYQTAIIVLDANVLLSVYRAGKGADQILKTFQACVERLWVPYQAAYEYHRNRLEVIDRQNSVYKDIDNLWKKLELDLLSKTQQAPDDLRNKIGDWYKEARAVFYTDIETVRTDNTLDPDASVRSDPLRDQWDQLLQGRVGNRPDDAALIKRRLDARERALKKVPPGYKDYKDNGGNKQDDQAAGDYLIWSEVLDHARVAERPILFVTNDQKEDWFEKGSSGKVLGPRHELLQEIQAVTQHRYWQATIDTFLHLAPKFLHTVQVSQETIERVTPEPIATVNPDTMGALEDDALRASIYRYHELDQRDPSSREFVEMLKLGAPPDQVVEQMRFRMDNSPPTAQIDELDELDALTRLASVRGLTPEALADMVKSGTRTGLEAREVIRIIRNGLAHNIVPEDIQRMIFRSASKRLGGLRRVAQVRPMDVSDK